MRLFGASASLREFVELFLRRQNEPEARIIVPKGFEEAFADPQTDDEREAKRLIEAFRAQQATEFEQELFKQRKRLADAERTLATKTTKAATESQRIAGEKVEWLLAEPVEPAQPRSLRRRSACLPWALRAGDGRRERPARRQADALPMPAAGKPPHWDAKYPGTYNARRDNLEGEFWRRVSPASGSSSPRCRILCFASH